MERYNERNFWGIHYKLIESSARVPARVPGTPYLIIDELVCARWFVNMARMARVVVEIGGQTPIKLLDCVALNNLHEI